MNKQLSKQSSKSAKSRLQKKAGCEFCGMSATDSYQDGNGVTHSVCSHHLPNAHSESKGAEKQEKKKHAAEKTPANLIPKGALCELCGMLATSTTSDENGISHYWCEHHAPKEETEVHSDHDDHAAHGAKRNQHSGHSANAFRDKFWISLILTIPIIALAGFFQKTFGYSLQFYGAPVVSAVLGSAIFFYGGLVFLKSAYSELKAKLPGMMTLIAIAITAAYLYSLAITFNILKGSDFFWELASLITVMLLGHWLEMKSVSGAQNALGELAKLLPDTAEKVQDTQRNLYQEVAVSELKVGDLVLVRPGAKVPADGIITDGGSDVDESMISGESKPVNKKKGDSIIAGTVNSGGGALTVKITNVGRDTALAGIMRLVAQAQQSKSRSQILADRAAFYLTIIAITIGGLTGAGWLVVGAGVAFAVERLVTVLIITCPHALGLAVPLVTSISTSISAKNGLLIRNRQALESARSIDVVLFDKTGTLTKGEMEVSDVIAERGRKKEDVMRIAMALEQKSEHAIAKAIVKSVKRKLSKSNLELKVKDFQALKGCGVQGVINGKKYYLGNARLLKSLKIKCRLEKDAEILSRQGKTVVYLLENRSAIGIIAVADSVRPESKEAVKKLHRLGKKVAMVTGDSAEVAQSVAQEIGIDTVYANVLPQDKVEKVKELQSKKLKVAMVGDGVNDAPSLAQADVGIAIGAGTDVAVESAGIILVKNDPRDVVKIFALSRATYRKMLQNLWWAVGYNIVAIPLATGFLGVALNPAVGALLMSLSTVIVAFNAQLLKKIKLAS